MANVGLDSSCADLFPPAPHWLYNYNSQILTATVAISLGINRKPRGSDSDTVSPLGPALVIWEFGKMDRVCQSCLRLNTEGPRGLQPGSF